MNKGDWFIYELMVSEINNCQIAGLKGLHIHKEQLTKAINSMSRLDETRAALNTVLIDHTSKKNSQVHITDYKGRCSGSKGEWAGWNLKVTEVGKTALDEYLKGSIHHKFALPMKVSDGAE